MQAIIFDWSGTLSDNFHCFCKVAEYMFEELGKEPISPEEIRKTFTLPYMAFWNHHFPDLTKENQEKLYLKHVVKGGSAHLYPGVKEYVSSLTLPLYVVSSDPEEQLSEYIKESGLSFKEVRGGVHDKADVLSELCAKHNLDPGKTVYVGDTAGDVSAGKAAGLITVGITWGFQNAELLKKSNPDYVIDTLPELSRVLEQDS